MGEPNVYIHSQTPHGSLRSSPVPDPLDTSRRLPLPGSGRPVLMGLPVFSVALVLFLGLFTVHASAADKTGGLGVAGEPQVDDAVCVTKCVDARKATPGSKVRVEGDYLESVSRVVFAGANGPIPAGYARRGYGAVTATVPKGAVSGRVSVVAADGTRSNRTPRELEVLPPSMIPEEVFPIRGRYYPFTPNFGEDRGTHMHQGQDIGAPCGTTLVSVRKAVVEVRDTQAGGAGNYVVLRNLGTNTRFVYMHLQEPSPRREGDRLGAGQVVGQVGNTGRSFGCHLHFEYWVGQWWTGGKPIDPFPYLRSLLRK